MDEASDSTKRPPDDPPPPPPPKMMAMVNPNAQAYAQNIALQAEIQGIREEMQKQAKQAQIAQEVQNRIITANTNPRTEKKVSFKRLYSRQSHCPRHHHSIAS